MLIFKILIIVIIVAIMLALNKLKVFKEPYTGSTAQKVIILYIIIIFVIMLLSKPMFCVKYLDEDNDIYNKYLVDAIIQGKASIDLEPSEELKKLENPYNIEDRQNIDYSFDTAYYNGKYYVYFGAVPAVLLFVPYKIITGQYLGTDVGTFIFVILSMIASTMLIIEIYKRWFKKLPFAMLIIFIISGLISGMYVWNTWRMWAYELAIMSGYFFVQFGLWLMMKATRDLNRLKLKYVFLSCLSMALAVGCRPTLVLASALLLPFIYDILKNTKKENRVNLLKTIASIIIPYIIVAIPIMIYNYARFGSIFEFGAKYQLTVVNVTDLSDRYKDIPKGLYQYLLQPPKIVHEFPYLQVDYSTEGFTLNYHNGGIISGIIFLNLTIISCIFLYKYYKRSNDDILKGLMFFLPIIGIVMCIVTVVVGASIQRYVVDFFWMFSYLGMIIWFLMYENAKSETRKKCIFMMLLILILVSIIMNFYGTFLNSEYDYIRTYCPKLFKYFYDILH